MPRDNFSKGCFFSNLWSSTFSVAHFLSPLSDLLLGFLSWPFSFNFCILESNKNEKNSKYNALAPLDREVGQKSIFPFFSSEFCNFTFPREKCSFSFLNGIFIFSTFFWILYFPRKYLAIHWASFAVPPIMIRGYISITRIYADDANFECRENWQYHWY